MAKCLRRITIFLLSGFILLMMFLTLNRGQLEERFKARFQSALGDLFKVTFHIQHINYRIYPKPFLQLEGIHLAMPGNPAAHFLAMESLIAYPDLKGLRQGVLLFHSIWINHPVFSLVRDEHGLHIKGTEVPFVAPSQNVGPSVGRTTESPRVSLNLPDLVQIQGLNVIGTELSLEDEIAHRQQIFSPLSLYTQLRIRDGVVTFEGARIKTRIHGDSIRKGASKFLTFLDITKLEMKPIPFQGGFRALGPRVPDPIESGKPILTVESGPMKLEQFLLLGDGSQPMWFRAGMRLDYRQSSTEFTQQLRIDLEQGTLMPAFRPMDTLNAHIALAQKDGNWDWHQQASFKLNQVDINMNSEGHVVPLNGHWAAKTRLLGLCGESNVWASTDEAGTHIKVEAKAIDWGALLKITQPSQSSRMTGTIDRLDIDATAPRGGGIFRHLEGAVRLEMGKGTINGFNLPAAIFNGYDEGIFERSDPGKTPLIADFLHEDRTAFKELQLLARLKGLGLLIDRLTLDDESFHLEASGEWVHQIPEQLHGKLVIEPQRRAELDRLSPVLQKEGRNKEALGFRFDAESGAFKPE